MVKNVISGKVPIGLKGFGNFITFLMLAWHLGEGLVDPLFLATSSDEGLTGSRFVSTSNYCFSAI